MYANVLNTKPLNVQGALIEEEMLSGHIQLLSSQMDLRKYSETFLKHLYMTAYNIDNYNYYNDLRNEVVICCFALNFYL